MLQRGGNLKACLWKKQVINAAYYKILFIYNAPNGQIYREKVDSRWFKIRGTGGAGRW